MIQLFYLRDSRTNVGRSCLFWAKDGCGYTSDLNKAHVYTLEEAQRQFNSRHTDVPLCKELVDELATVRVDCQYLPADGEKAGCDEYVISPKGKCDGNDVYWLGIDMFSVNYKSAFVLSYRRALEHFKLLGIDVNIYAKSEIDAIARRTFQVANINERKMITAAGIRKPKRKRTRHTTGKTRGNCPDCGAITWGFNPYEAYTCAQADAENRGFKLYGNCKEVKRAKQISKAKIEGEAA